MKIGYKIKHLRLKNNITQERLAEYLNISFQAVSKWENDTAYPDIKLLVPLSNFFNVSVDYLLDNEDDHETVEVNMIMDKYNKFNNKGKVEQAIELVRKGLKTYPKNYLLMSKLTQSLTTITKSTHEHDMEKNAKEAIKLCQMIIGDSHDYGLINSAISTMFYATIDLKDYEKAVEIANKRPTLYHSKEVLLTNAYVGSDANNYIQKFIMQIMDLLATYTFSLTYKRYGSEVYSIEDKIEITKSAIKIIETIINDGNYLFYSNRLRRFYTFLGIFYAEIGKESEMYTALETAKELSLYYDSLDQDANYTSLTTNTQVFKNSETIVNAEWTDFYVFKDRLKRKEFDLYRNDNRFKELYNE